MVDKRRRPGPGFNKKKLGENKNEIDPSSSSMRGSQSTGAASRQGPNSKEGDEYSRDRQDSNLETHKESATSPTDSGSVSDRCPCSGIDRKKSPEIQLNGQPIKACAECEEDVYVVAGRVMPSKPQSKARSSSIFGRWSSEVRLKHGEDAVEVLEVGEEAVEKLRGRNKSRVFSEADVDLEDWMRAALVREYEESLQQEIERNSDSAVRVHHSADSS